MAVQRWWQAWSNQVHRWWHRRTLPVWYTPAYRLPVAQLDVATGLEPRRADFAIWYLLERRVVDLSDVREPVRVRYRDIARVHTCAYLESLSQPEALARIFAVDAHLIPVDEVMRSIRLACGGTLAAAKEALDTRSATLNLLGGFHHASPSSGGGFCVLNDIAIAIAVLRSEGFAEQIVVLDFDAHPPDGLADCLVNDPLVWVGSLSGSDWGPLPCVDETVLPRRAEDHVYLDALERLLARMPRPALAFVIAGGDVLAGDMLGMLGMTLAGARKRDLAVKKAMAGIPSVWVPGGGYHRDTWKLLAGTGMALALDTETLIPETYDPLRARFTRIAQKITSESLEGEAWITNDDLAEALGMPSSQHYRLLDFYTAEGIEYALFRYGLSDHVRRLGYGAPRVVIDRTSVGDRMRVYAEGGGAEHLIAELVVEKQEAENVSVLYIHWLTLRHGMATFGSERPQLPGQEKPGLGLAREAGEMLLRMAERLGLKGVMLRPAWYHIAYAMRADFRFVDPARQGRFEALIRDLAGIPLREATQLVAQELVEMDGQTYLWEPEPMVYWLESHEFDRTIVEQVREQALFSIKKRLDEKTLSSITTAHARTTLSMPSLP